MITKIAKRALSGRTILHRLGGLTKVTLLTMTVLSLLGMPPGFAQNERGRILSTSEQQYQNMVKNASFEAFSAGSSVAPDGFVAAGVSTGTGSVARDASGKFQAYAVKLTQTNAADSYILRYDTAITGFGASITGATATADLTTTEWQRIVLSSTNGYVASVWVKLPGGASNPASVTIKSDVNQKIYVEIAADANNDYCYIDGFQVTEGPQAIAVMNNPITDTGDQQVFGDLTIKDPANSANYIILDKDTGNITMSGTLSATATNADTLDTLDSTQFLRSDASDSVTTGATLNVDAGAVLSIDGSWNINGTTVTPTAAEINILSGGLSSAELDAVLLTASEGDAAYVNIGGDTMTGALNMSSAGITNAGPISGATTVSASVSVTTPLVNTSSGNLTLDPAGGTVTLGSGDAMSIPGDLTVDTTTLKVDSTRNMVGIGTSAPNASLDVAGSLQVSAAGDTGVAHDLVMTNIDASAIKSYGPMTVQSGSSNDNFHLTLKGSGTGKVYVDDDLEITGTTTFPSGLTVSGGNVTLGTAGATVDGVNLDNAVLTTGSYADPSWLTSLNATKLSTGTGAVTVAAGGTNQNVTVTPSGTGYTILNGNVGIGTTSPGAKLDVRTGHIRTSDDATAIAFLQGAGSVAYFGATGVHLVSIGNDEGYQTLNIDAGNVGIGTTAPSNKLQINDTDKALSVLHSAANTNFRVITTDTAAIDKGGSMAFGGYYNGTTDAWNFAGIKGAKENATANNGNGYLAFATSDNAVGAREWMRITSQGNVGIGTTAPGTKLDVAGAIRSSSTVDGTEIRASVDLQAPTYYPYASAGDLNLATLAGNNKSIIFKPNNSEVARITYGGLVGIGTTAPAGLLDISKALSGTPNTTGKYLSISSSTFTDNATAASGTAASMAFNSIAAPTLAASNTTVTTTDAATLYIAGAPQTGTNQAITNPYSLWVDDGNARFDGTVQLTGLKLTTGASNGYVLKSDANGTASWADLTSLPVGNANTLDNLDSAAFAILAGQSGGQTLRGGTSASENLTLDSTANATKGYVLIAPSGGNVGIGTTGPGAKLDIRGAMKFGDANGYFIGAPTQGFRFNNNADSLNLVHIYDTGGVAIGTTYAISTDPGVNNLIIQGNVGIGTTSPRELLDVVGGSATIYDIASLGSEKVTNGAFTSNIYIWTISGTGTGWTWSTGTALHGAGNTETLSQDLTEVAGEIYQVVFTVVGRTAGSVTMSVGGVSGAAVSSNITSTQQIWATGTGNLTFTPTSDFDGSLDNVSVKLVTGGDLKLAGLLTGGGTSGIKVTAAGNVGIGTANPNNVFQVANFIVFSEGTYSKSVAIGYQAGLGSPNNTAIGYQALMNTYDGDNTAVGARALYNNYDSWGNTAVGSQALYSNNSETHYSTAVGAYALYNSQRRENTAVGYQALYNNTQGINTAIGYKALYGNTTGEYNIGIGNSVLYTNAIGYYNTAVGHSALYNASGTGNIALGYQAGNNLTTGSNNIIIGYDIDAPAVDSANILNIGNLIFATGIDGTGTTLSTGNVGIGTTGPATALHIAGSTGVTIGEDKTAGTANTVATMKLISAGDNAYYTTITPGTQTANADYTLPVALPASNGQALTSTTAGVLSWANAGVNDATYITQTPNSILSAEQALSALATGLLKNTTTIGVLSIATAGTDYYNPGGTDVAVADGGTGASDAVTARTNLGLAIGTNVQAYDADLDDLADGSLTGSKVGTGIDAANVANGSVSNTEYQYLDGVSSGIQGQIDAKAATTYVDNAIAGLKWKGSVRVATTQAQALATDFLASENDQIDGITLVAGNRILIKNQATGSENGIYTVNASTAPTRASDADASSEILQTAVFVEEGTANADTAWVCNTNAPITLNTTALSFTQFTGAAAYLWGDGLSNSGNTINVGAGTGITVDANNVNLSSGYADGSTYDTRFVNVAGDTMTNTLTFSGAATDITTGTNEHLALMPNGTGNVGIGTTNPGNKLEVSGHILATGMLYAYSGGTALGNNVIGSYNGAVTLGLGHFGTGALALYTNNTEKVRIDTSGNVGIGTTSPGAKLDVRTGHIRTSDDATAIAFLQGAGSVAYFGATGVHLVSIGNDEGYQTLNIDAGNVGIGTTNPTGKLTINHSGEAIRLERSGFDTWSIYQTSSITGNGLGFYDDTDSAYRLVISDAGNVGIGTTNPASKLTVSGGDLALQTTKKVILDSDDSSDTYMAHDSTNDRVSIYVDGIEMVRINK